MKTIVTATLLMALAAGPHAYGQWQNVPDKSIPRTSSGEPDLTAPVPRAANGKPNLSGTWLPDVDPPPEGELFVEVDQPFPRHIIDIMADLKPGEVEMTPWAAALFEQRLERGDLDSPIANCKPWGVPLLTANIIPYKIVQMPDLIIILNEQDTVFRQIFLDGRQPVDDPLPRWMGYSTGRWDGDALIVDTTGIIEDSWLDAIGHPHSENLHVIERFRRRDTGHLEIETTIDDPDAYAQLFTYTVTAKIMPDDDLLEYFCTDNELSIEHYQ